MASRRREHRSRTRYEPYTRRSRDDESPRNAESKTDSSTPVVIAHLDSVRTECSWRPYFLRQNFCVYDVKYPFRLAAEAILRKNVHYGRKSRFADTNTDKFVTHLSDQTCQFFGVDFEYDYFMDWLRNRSERDARKRVVIFGLGNGMGAIKMIARMQKDEGAFVISTPNYPGDKVVHNTRELESFLADFSHRGTS